jgi:hypothetical protein
MKIQLFLFFIIASTFAQHPALTIKIDSITFTDLVSGERKMWYPIL